MILTDHEILTRWTNSVHTHCRALLHGPCTPLVRSYLSRLPKLWLRFQFRFDWLVYHEKFSKCSEGWILSEKPREEGPQPRSLCWHVFFFVWLLIYSRCLNSMMSILHQWTLTHIAGFVVAKISRLSPTDATCTLGSRIRTAMIAIRGFHPSTISVHFVQK